MNKEMEAVGMRSNLGRLAGARCSAKKPKWSGRSKWTQATAILAALLMLGERLRAAEPPARPNVVLIICDDLNDSVTGMGGHPQARTPNIDRLIARGVRFVNAQCNAPICGPSRASLWTGLYPHSTGYYGYNQQANHWRRFPAMAQAVTLPEYFKANGYLVGGTGKVFHNGHEDNSVWSPAAAAVGGSGVRPSFGPTPWNGVARGGSWSGCGHPSMPPPFHQAYWESFASLADVPVIPADPAHNLPGYAGWRLGDHPFRYVSETDRDRMPDELNAAWAAERLRRPQPKPFLMIVGMNRPHMPRYAPQKYFDMFPLETIQLPPYQKDDLADCAKILWQNPETGERLAQARALPDLLAAGGEALWKRSVQSYLACVAFVDDQIGTIRDALDNGPLASNTIVIVTSDQGLHLGEKDNLSKTTVWEEVARLPLVIAGPGLATGTCDHPVSLIDLYPTLIDLCGLPTSPNARGNHQPLGGFSLRPFLQNPATNQWAGPAVALSCCPGEEPVPNNTPAPKAKPHFSVRSRTHRYILCSDGEEELYDHSTDPNEWTNLASRPDQQKVKAGLKRQLLALIGSGQSSAVKSSP